MQNMCEFFLLMGCCVLIVKLYFGKWCRLLDCTWINAEKYHFPFHISAGEKGVRVELNKPSDSVGKDVL